MKEIKEDMTRYREENDNGEVNPIILCDALKVVIRGKLKARTAHLKRTKLELYQNLTGQLKEFEKQHKNTNDPEALAKVKETRSKMDKIQLTEVEKKVRFVKQAYYERGPKAITLSARRIRV